MSDTVLDEALSNLANVYRRRVLLSLLDHNPQAVGAPSIADDVSAGETDPEILRAKMYHHHLPKLEAAGFIRWHKDDNEVEQGPNFDEIKPLLELLVDNSDELPEGNLR